MKKIDSFKIDHRRMLRGVYVSRKDKIGGEWVTTFDIRMKEPNREPAVWSSTLHTIEHLAATYLRNHEEWGEKVVYWGPMGCCTGNYLIMRGDYVSSEIVPLLTEVFEFISAFEGEVPGANEHDCGNWTFNNLPMAKWEARKFLVEVLYRMRAENMSYPE